MCYLSYTLKTGIAPMFLSFLYTCVQCTLYRAPTCTFFEYFLMNYRQVIVFSRPAMHNKRFFWLALQAFKFYSKRVMAYYFCALYILEKFCLFMSLQKNLIEFVLKVGIGWPRWLGKWLMWKDRRRERKMGSKNTTGKKDKIKREINGFSFLFSQNLTKCLG